MVFRPFYVQKEFLRKIPSLPDFEIRDSDDTQTIILENIIRSSCTFFYFWGVLKDCCVSAIIMSRVFSRNMLEYLAEELKTIRLYSYCVFCANVMFFGSGSRRVGR